jgi:hypothetical protein
LERIEGGPEAWRFYARNNIVDAPRTFGQDDIDMDSRDGKVKNGRHRRSI